MARTDTARDLERLVDRALALEGETTRQSVQDIVTLVMELHRRGLAKMLALIQAHGAGGPALVGQLAADPEVGPLLMLHDMHPVALATRVTQALDEARASLHAQAGDVELVAIEPSGRVHVRLTGPESENPLSAAALRSTLEDALYEAAPEVSDLVLDARVPAAFAPVSEPAAQPPAPAR